VVVSPAGTTCSTIVSLAVLASESCGGVPVAAVEQVALTGWAPGPAIGHDGKDQ
jgi:hypothetical protein